MDKLFADELGALTIVSEMGGVKTIWLVVVAVLLFVPLRASAITGPCVLCIVEVQTQGLSGASEEYIIIANNTNASYDLAGHSLRYLTAGKNVGGTIVLSGSLSAGSTKSFVTSNVAAIKDANPQATPFSFGMSDTGGTLQILKSGQADAVDQVGWGTAGLFDSAASVVHERGWSLVRSRNANDIFQDSNNNANDFAAVPHACLGLAINEIQPLLVTMDGSDIDQAIELLMSGVGATDQDCPLEVNGVVQKIAAGDLGTGGLAVITNLLDSSDESILPGLHTDAANNLQFVPRSATGNAVIPGAALTQPIVQTGQTYAKFSTGFKPTYKPTLGAANQLQTTPPAVADQAPALSTDNCDAIIVNELLPNPLGEDTGQEWAEFTTEADNAVSLAGCILQVNGTNYSFGPDQFISSGQYVVLGTFSDGTVVHSLSLRNSGTNTVSFGRLNTSTSTFVPLQTVQYVDAPEGESWARFDDGWRWIQPTPGTENSLQTSVPAPTDPQPTEFAAPVDSSNVNPDNPAATGDPTNVGTTPGTSAALTITELLPNPAAPATDDVSEFVEVYNPTDQSVNLNGYKIQTGNNYTYSFTFDGGTVLPHQYAVFYSKDTNLVLSNTSGRARLLDPSGQVINETDPYADAADGAAWAVIGGVWQWTITPTPGSENIASIPLLATTKSTQPKTATAKKTTVATSKATTTKATPAKTTAVKAAKTTPDRQVYTDPAQAPPSIHPAILAGVGVITILYAAYEYRYDALNTIKRLQRYRNLRRATRAQSSGR